MTPFDRAALHGELVTAEHNIETIGDILAHENLNRYHEALALLFVVRKAVIDIVYSVFTPENSSAQKLLKSYMEDDSEFFSIMVHNLLTQSNDRCVYEVVNYYASIVRALSSSFLIDPAKQGSVEIQTRTFDIERAGIIQKQYADDDQMRTEIIGIQLQLSRLQPSLLAPSLPTAEERYMISMEIVRMRELLFSMFKQVMNRYLGGEKGLKAGGMEDAFLEDIYRLDGMVTEIVAQGVSPQGSYMIVRLLDFSHRIERFLACRDVAFFQGPFVENPDAVVL